METFLACCPMYMCIGFYGQGGPGGLQDDPRWHPPLRTLLQPDGQAGEPVEGEREENAWHEKEEDGDEVALVAVVAMPGFDRLWHPSLLRPSRKCRSTGYGRS